MPARWRDTQRQIDRESERTRESYCSHKHNKQTNTNSKTNIHNQLKADSKLIQEQQLQAIFSYSYSLARSRRIKRWRKSGKRKERAQLTIYLVTYTHLQTLIELRALAKQCCVLCVCMFSLNLEASRSLILAICICQHEQHYD